MANSIKMSILTLLDGGNAWIKGANARDADGKPCSALSGNAVSFDLYGALIRVLADTNPGNYALFHKVYDGLRSNLPPGYKNQDIESWNDEADWSDINSFLNLDFFSNIRAHAFTGDALTLQGLD